MRFLPSDLQPLLGRLPVQRSLTPNTDWLRQGAAFGMCLPGPRGTGLDLQLSLQGLNPDAPTLRWLRPCQPPTRFQLTAGVLVKVFTRTGTTTLQAYAAPLNLYLQRYRIDSIARMACFMGQVGIESGGLRTVVENLNYTSVARLKATFSSKRFGNTPVEDLVRNPEGLANQVYAGRGGNGDVASGDGWAFRGRGLIQITLRDNYLAFSDDTGVDAVRQPDLLLLPSNAVMSACWYWDKHGLNTLADQGGIEQLTARINTAKHALAERIALTEQAAAVLRSESLRLP